MSAVRSVMRRLRRGRNGGYEGGALSVRGSFAAGASVAALSLGLGGAGVASGAPAPAPEDVARPAPATDPNGPWRSDDHEPRRGRWRDYVLAPSHRSLAAESVLQAAARDGAIDGDPNAALRADGRVVRLTNGAAGDRSGSPLLALDFGQEVGGHVRVKLSGASDPRPRLHACFSESKRYRALGTRNDGQARFAPGCDTANIWVGFPGRAYTYDADSHTLEIPASLPGTAVDGVLRGGFRYLTLFLDGPGSVEVDSVTVDYAPEPSRRDPSRLEGWFNSSDGLLNRIWHAGVYTVQINTDRADTAKSWPYRDGERDHADGQLPHLDPDDEVIYDGGKRDRLIWQGDLAVQNPVAYVSTGHLEAVENSMDQLAAQQLEDGFVPGSSQMGAHNEGERRNYGEYVTWFVFNMAEHWRHTGDRGYLRRWWPALTRATAWLESVRAQDDRGLIGFGRVNSCGHYGYSDCGHETYVNALYKRNLEQMATLADAMGERAAARTYAARAGEVARAIEAQLWDDEAGAYRLSRELPGAHPQDGNAAAILTGVATPERARRALAFLRANSWSRYGGLTISPDEPNPSLSPFYAPLPSGFETEARFGLADDPRGLSDVTALQLMKRFWGHQLDQDPGSTFFEHLQPSGYPNLSQFSSLAHGWASAPTYVLSKQVLGIEPTAAGYARVDVTPHPADLRWAEGAVPTPHGDVAAAWERRRDDGFSLQVRIPSRSVVGRASVPTFGRRVQVRLDGRLVWDGRRPRAEDRRGPRDGDDRHAQGGRPAPVGVRLVDDRVVVDGLGRGSHTLTSRAIDRPSRDSDVSLVVTPASRTVEPGDLVALRAGISGVSVRGDLEGELTVVGPADWDVSPARVAFALESDGRPVAVERRLYVQVPQDARSGAHEVRVAVRTRDGATATGTATLRLTATKRLFGFESDAEGWAAGEHVVSVARVGSFANGPGRPAEGAGALEATARSAPASALRTISVTPAAPLDLTEATALSLSIDAYGGAPGATGYEAVVRATSADGTSRESTTAVQADAWNRVGVDLAGWPGRAAVARIEVGFRAVGSDTAWQPRFQIDDVGVVTG